MNCSKHRTGKLRKVSLFDVICFTESSAFFAEKILILHVKMVFTKLYKAIMSK